MAQQIKKKFIRNDAVDGTKIKLLSGQSLRIEGPSGEVELLKLGSQGEVLSNGQEIAFKSQVDELRSDLELEESTRIAADQSLQSQIDNILSNVDPAALDSLTEIVQAFQSADEDLYETISLLGTGAASAVAQETSRAQAAEAALQIEIDQVESDLAQEILDRQQDVDQEESRAMAAESFLQSEIDSEESRAQAAEVALQLEIEGKVSKSGDTVTGAIDFVSPISSDPVVLQVANNYLSVFNLNEASAPYTNVESDKVLVESQVSGSSSTLVDGVSVDLSRITTSSGLLEDGSLETTKKRIVQIDQNQSHTVSNSESQVLFNRMTVRVDSSPFSIVDGQIVQDPSQVITRRTNLQGGAELTVSKTSQSGESNQIIANAEEYARIQLLENGTSPSMPLAPSDVTVKKYVDDRDNEISMLFGEEQSRALVAEAFLQGQIHSEESARIAADLEITGTINSEIQRAMDAEALLDGKIETEKGRIDAILSASNADYDSFAEIVQLINSVDTENDSAFASYVLSNNASVAELDERLDIIEPKVSTLESEMDQAQFDIDAVEARLDLVEPKVATLETEMNAVEASILAETSRAMSAESSLSSSISAETSRALAAENSISAALQLEISRATSFETSLQDQITEEISRSMFADSELENRIVELEESVESLDSQYSFLQSEVSVLQSETSSSIVFLQSQVDTLRSDLSEEISDRIADVINAEQTLEQKIKEVGVSFKRETQLVTQQMINNGFFMLQNKAFDNSTTISIGRLFLIEDEDYQVVLEGGVSKVIFMGSILPNQDESLEVDDLIKVKYFKDSRS